MVLPSWLSSVDTPLLSLACGAHAHMPTPTDTMADEPYSALRARDLAGMFEQPTPYSSAAQGTKSPLRFMSSASAADTAGQEMRVYVPRTPLASETSYVHDFPVHPLGNRCVRDAHRWGGEEGKNGPGVVLDCNAKRLERTVFFGGIRDRRFALALLFSDLFGLMRCVLM